MSSFSIGTAAEALFSVSDQQAAQRENIANGALVNGTRLYSDKKYNEAIKEFKRAVSLAPYSANTVDAYNFMAVTYLKLNKPEDAVKAYKSAISLDPYRDDTHMKLGNVYMSLNRNSEAESEFKSAIKQNPSSTGNIYTLGQLYINSGRYNEAENQFNKIINLAPRKADGYYGLGQAYSKQGKYEDAIKQFKEAINMNGDFKYAYADLGYAYADSGQREEAGKQVDLLKTMDSSLANTLSKYISNVSAPKILFVDYAAGTFATSLPPRTTLPLLDSSLATPGASKDFSVVFYFDKQMDMASVLNPTNWQIKRAPYGTPGGAYNWGLSIPQTEVTVPSLPKSIIYDQDNNKATLTFTVAQNAAGDGTIDPSHLIFKFNGKDVNGLVMDEARNEFDGMAGVF